MVEKVEIPENRMEDVRKAVKAFRDAVAGHLKDLNVEVKDWHFGTSCQEDGSCIVDVGVKLSLTSKSKK